jgi:hypothetical protein
VVGGLPDQLEMSEYRRQDIRYSLVQLKRRQARTQRLSSHRARIIDEGRKGLEYSATSTETGTRPSKDSGESAAEDFSHAEFLKSIVENVVNKVYRQLRHGHSSNRSGRRQSLRHNQICFRALRTLEKRILVWLDKFPGSVVRFEQNQLGRQESQ